MDVCDRVLGKEPISLRAVKELCTGMTAQELLDALEASDSCFVHYTRFLNWLGMSHKQHESPDLPLMRAVSEAKTEPIDFNVCSKPQVQNRMPTLQQFYEFDTYIFDCDGVIWGIEDDDSKTSVTTINNLLAQGKRVMFITNNSNKIRASFVKELEKKGINFGDHDQDQKLSMMISASYTTAAYCKENGLRRPFVITSDRGVLDELEHAGINDYITTFGENVFNDPTLKQSDMEEFIARNPAPDCVVVGWDQGLTLRKVGTAVNYIKWHADTNGGNADFKQLPLIACSGDSSGVLGMANYCSHRVKVRAIGNGAMAEIISRSFDPPHPWLDMGKPSEMLLDILRNPDAYAVDPSRSIMVGDTLQTDIVFGNRGGMTTLLVLTGVTTAFELKQAMDMDDRNRWPDYVMPKLGHFVETGELCAAS